MRYVLILGALLSLLVPAPAAAAGRTNHSTNEVLSATAHLTTVPVSGEVVGEIYTDTVIGATVQVATFEGQEQHFGGMGFFQETYRADGTTSPPLLEFSFGLLFDFGHMEGVSVSHDLRSASAHHTIPITRCSRSLGQPFTCVDETVTIDVEWISTDGVRSGNVKPIHFSEEGFTHNSHHHWRSRLATAVATVDGQPVPGRIEWTEVPTTISGSDTRDVGVCHGPSVC
jgi:hypothetical protein